MIAPTLASTSTLNLVAERIDQHMKDSVEQMEFFDISSLIKGQEPLRFAEQLQRKLAPKYHTVIKERGNDVGMQVYATGYGPGMVGTLVR